MKAIAPRSVVAATGLSTTIPVDTATTKATTTAKVLATKAVLQQPDVALGTDDHKGLAQKTTPQTKNAQASRG
jgi:hypothetical protein